MFEFIKTLLIKSNKKDAASEVKKSKVIFSLDENGLMDMEIFAYSNNVDDAANLGNLLYGLNNGIYAEEIVSTVMQIGKNNPEYIQFCNVVILRWHSLINTAKRLDAKPIVPPSQFGGSSK